MKTAFNTIAWGLHAPGPPAHDPAHAVVAAAEGADFTLYDCSRHGLELIGRERVPSGGDSLETLARRLEDCDLVLDAEAMPGLRARLERAGVEVRPIGAGERQAAVLAAWRAWRSELASPRTVRRFTAPVAAPALLGG